MFHDLDSHRLYHAQRAKELYHEAEQERMAGNIRASRPRFYYATLAGFGRWLMVSGLRLHRRYGEHHLYSGVSSRPTHFYSKGEAS